MEQYGGEDVCIEYLVFIHFFIAGQFIYRNLRSGAWGVIPRFLLHIIARRRQQSHLLVNVGVSGYTLFSVSQAFVFAPYSYFLMKTFKKKISEDKELKGACGHSYPRTVDLSDWIDVLETKNIRKQLR